MRNKNHNGVPGRVPAVGFAARWRARSRGQMAGFGLIVLLFCGVLPVPGQPMKSLPKPAGYVGDFAHVMSAGTIARLNKICGKVEQETHDRIDVVTVQTTDGEPIEEYAAKLQRAWKVGNREAMILVAVGQRQRWIAAEIGLGPVFLREELRKVSGQMVPMLRNNDFDGAMKLAVDELAARMTHHAGVKVSLRLPWDTSVAVPVEDRWLKLVTWGLTVLLFASLGVWAYASGLGDAVRRKMSKRMERQRQ